MHYVPNILETSMEHTDNPQTFHRESQCEEQMNWSHAKFFFNYELRQFSTKIVKRVIV